MNKALDLALTLSDRDHATTTLVHARTRVCAHLARQGLEAELRSFWQRFQPGMEKVSIRAQLVCLPVFFSRDPELARLVGFVWGRLAEACHAGVYELGVGRGEMGRWVEVIDRFHVVNIALSNARNSSG